MLGHSAKRSFVPGGLFLHVNFSSCRWVSGVGSCYQSRFQRYMGAVVGLITQSKFKFLSWCFPVLQIACNLLGCL